MTSVEKKTIDKEVERRFPLSSFNEVPNVKKLREQYLFATIFALSPYYWVSVKDRLPTKQDADENKNIWAWDKKNGRVVTISYLHIGLLKKKYSHWRIIDKTKK